MPEIRLGPFSALQPFGQGGMAEVWRGLHRAQGVPVAIKFVSHSEELSETWFEQFRSEVRAVAGLNHDSIVMVFDHGRVDAQAAAASGGAIKEGTPWLAMEFCSGQSLFHVRPTQFEELADILDRILSALAYAHARGVLHRDLKPDNVMFSTGEDARPGLKLTDFGLAFDLGDVIDDESRTVGTPHYMAPEQCYGNWRDYGPWTDLYAVGCLAWDLCTGRPPFFGHKRLVQLLTAHVRQPLPELRPSFDIPEGFEGWMRRLLEKLASERFQNAADARESLRRLVKGELPRWQNPMTENPELRDSQTIMVDISPFREPDPHQHFSDQPTSEFGTAEERPREHELAQRVIPEMPVHWQSAVPPQPEPRLVGAGLNLFGLRQVPMVDRFDERDLLWNALKRVRQTRKSRVVVLEGPAGTGKSRIAEWMAVRSTELGVARVLQVGHDPTQAPGVALADLCAQVLRTQGLSGDALSERVTKVLERQGVVDPVERDALISLLGTEELDLLASSGTMTISFADPRERYAVLRRLLSRVANERPIVLCLDDLQWGSDALAFVDYLLENQELHSFPVLMILTHRQELLDDNPLEQSLLRQLLESEFCDRRVVSELPPQYRTELVEEMLGLEAGLAAKVVERSGGNPLFAVQLVGDWVERRVLEVGDAGFRLAKGERAELPDDIHSLWSQRLHSIAKNYPQTSLISLEFAAALGQDVDEHELHMVCTQVGVPLGRALIDDLLGQDLMEIREGGWRFSHHLFRESIGRQSREQSRWAAAHRHCATALAKMPRRRGLSYRIAQHFLAAQAFEEALDPLSNAVKEFAQGGSIGETKAVLADYDLALSKLGLSDDDTRYALRLYVEVGVAEGAADWDRLESLVKQLDQAAWPHMKGTVLRSASKLAAARGEWDRGLHLARKAIEQSEDDQRGQASGLLGMQLLARGQLVEAQDALENALALSGPQFAGSNQLGLAMVAQQRGDLVAAESHYQRALEAYEAGGQLAGIGNAINGVAEIARLRGDLNRAKEEYTRAMEMYETTGRSTAVVAMNLALTLMNQESFDEAEEYLNRAVAELKGLGSAGWLIYAQTLLLPCLIARQDWAHFTEAFVEAQAKVKKAGIVDGDLAWSLEKAGDLARAEEQSQAARDCYGFALSQWQQLKRADDVQRLERLLAQS
ncbi:MAG: hypothetical protein CMH50_12500 [Myxococcales bacterium]|nr:hypothetical protein [Myxococcales bacterium]